MIKDEKYRLAGNHDIFSDDYIPLNVLGRGAQIRELVYCISTPRPLLYVITEP